jgi:hypothetical protein
MVHLSIFFRFLWDFCLEYDLVYSSFRLFVMICASLLEHALLPAASAVYFVVYVSRHFFGKPELYQNDIPVPCRFSQKLKDSRRQPGTAFTH